ncbi:MAG: PspA/IM30 family protein [Myxococcota bacterium]
MRNRHRNPNAPLRVHEPAAALDPVLGAMQTQLAQAQRQTAVAIADERRLRQWVEHCSGHASGWEQRAMLAVRAGDEGLARQALQRKAQWDDQARAYRAQWQDQKQSVDQLRAGLAALADRIAGAQRQRNALIARTVAAQARMSVAHTLAQMDSANPWSTLSQMEDRVVQMEAHAEAASELHLGMDDSLEAQFAALEASTVDDELAALKASMGLGPRALPS